MRSLSMGAIAVGIATVCLPPDLAAQETNLGIIVLAGTNQVMLQRTVEKTKTTAPVESGTPAAVAPQPNVIPVWVPRIREGAPASRIGGATRAREKPVTIQILVPEVDEAALTLAAQPNLHWHLSTDTTYPVNFTLIDPEAIEPVVDEMIAGPFEAGFHTLSLADYEAKLEPGRHYEWFVAVVPDPENRASDTVARGAISRITDPELASRVAKAEPDDVPRLLAQSGIWYEAIDALSRGVRQSPEDLELRMRRTAMLEQVGLVIAEDR
ncbi:MAG: DUF928 domain-containing protein [Deltaproteobacteria bacterium]|nr:DUF928 domain-containing protein [Deltaproteobacteria bacterium]